MEPKYFNFKLNRTQKFLLSNFNEDLTDQEFNNLQAVIQDFRQQSGLAKQIVPTETINWASDFFLNEILNHASIQVANMYFKLAYNYPSHENVAYWNGKEKEWRGYRVSMHQLFFATKKEMEEEIERVSSEYKRMLAQEDEHLKIKI